MWMWIYKQPLVRQLIVRLKNVLDHLWMWPPSIMKHFNTDSLIFSELSTFYRLKQEEFQTEFLFLIPQIGAGSLGFYEKSEMNQV